MDYASFIWVMRQPRIKLSTHMTAYHVMTRTCQQVYNLGHADTPGFKKVCRDILEQLLGVYYINLHAWIFMDNHFHLCITVEKPKLDELDERDLQNRFERLQAMNVRQAKWSDHLIERLHQRFTDLSCFMWELNRRIAVAYNKIHETVGHFWGGRFKSIVLEDEAAALRVMAYIEQNPVKARLVDKPSEYKACSTSDNLALAKQGKTPMTKAIGWLKKVAPKKFAWIYKSFMDWLASVRFSKDPEPFPVELITYKKFIPDTSRWAKDFDEKEPENWARQGYGNEAFVNYIDNLEQDAKCKVSNT